MSRGYIYDSRIGWSDYLKLNQLHEIEGDIKELRYDISSSSRELIATYDELQRENISAVRSIEDAISSGYEQLSFDINKVYKEIKTLNSFFDWKLNEILIKIGDINTSINELIRISKTPAQTWAYEQFDIARDAYKKNLYQEALEYLYRSIHGYGDNTGYKIDYRFHFLLGTIRLGSLKNSSSSVIDLKEAENAFLAAAKYALHEHPHEAAKAFISAGWAAYCQNRIKIAIEYTEKAISTSSYMGEAYFQLSKFLIHDNLPDKAIKHLKTAITIDRNYFVKVYNDDDFKKYENNVNALLKQMHKESKENALITIDDLEKRIKSLKNINIQEYSIIDIIDFCELEEYMQNILKSASNNTYYGYLDVISKSNIAIKIINKIKDEYKKHVSNDIKQKTSNISGEINKIKEKYEPYKNIFFPIKGALSNLFTIGIIFFLILSIYQCVQDRPAIYDETFISQQKYDKIIETLKANGHISEREHNWYVANHYGYTKENMNAKKLNEKNAINYIFWLLFRWLMTIVIGLVMSYVIVNIIWSRIKKSKRLNFKHEYEKLSNETERLEGIKNKIKEI